MYLRTYIYNINLTSLEKNEGTGWGEECKLWAWEGWKAVTPKLCGRDMHQFPKMNAVIIDHKPILIKKVQTKNTASINSNSYMDGDLKIDFKTAHVQYVRTMRKY